MNKRKIHHAMTVIRHIKMWQLVALLIVFGLLAAFTLRQNNLRMIELRNAVTKADEQNGDTKKALTELQKYVSGHMNTDLGNGVYLQNTYQRAYEAAVQAAVTATNPNSQLYTQVELECRPVYQSTHSFPAYTQCAHQKLDSLQPGQDALAVLKTPNVDLYHFNFLAPIWSADAAGAFVLITGVIGLFIVTRTITYVVLLILLRPHKTPA